jgi:penicillin-binding protein 1A
VSEQQRPREKTKKLVKKTPWALRFLRWSFRMLFFTALVVIPMGIGLATVFYNKIASELPDVSALKNFDAPQTSRILASDGQVIATLFDENRTAVKLEQVSPYFAKALVATEDSRFYQHAGVDWWGVSRAVVANIVHRGIDQGASTLTMQLARNRFLSQKQDFSRKIREAILATKIEEKFSKEVILEHYINTVYFGSGAYGIGAASSLYFDRKPSDLNLAQAALIAGLVQAPSALTPLENPKGAVKRMKIVLHRMKEMNYITEAEMTAAIAEGEHLKFRRGGSAQGEASSSDQLLKFPYYTSYAISELSRRYAQDMLYRGGLKINTTLDVELQKICEREVEQIMASQGPGLNAHTAAAVLIENKTGYVRAMVGGTRWSQKSQFNRAYQAERQPGSSFKPVVYTAALLEGATPETIVPDKSVSFGSWTPKNSDGQFMGDIPLRTGLQFSRNPVSAQLAQQVTPAKLIQLARAMGVTEELTENLSLSLGSCEVSPLTMARVYSTIASGGQARLPLMVTVIESGTGETLTDNRNVRATRVFDPDISAQMTEMMQRVVTAGTGTAASLGDVPVAGKTGTTDDSRDAWFVGYTPDYTLAVWVGNDDHSAMYGVFGGGLPATIWHSIMSEIIRRKPPTMEFSFFAGREAHKVKLCKKSTMLATPGCKETYEDTFRCGIEPSEKCRLHLNETPSPSPSPSATESPDPEETPLETPSPEETPAELPPEIPSGNEIPAEPTPISTPIQ